MLKSDDVRDYNAVMAEATGIDQQQQASSTF